MQIKATTRLLRAILTLLKTTDKSELFQTRKKSRVYQTTRPGYTQTII